ncbi:RecF/RecN/SMC N terminal domain-containing protein [Phycomyces nitens]|nr:RecF/RecN/SMC N terminal domain-containing protein [Phycomyces nitens]
MSKPPRKKQHIEEDDTIAGEQVHVLETSPVQDDLSNDDRSPFPSIPSAEPEKSPSIEATPLPTPISQRTPAPETPEVPVSDRSEEQKPRLVITKMVLNHFKSYAGRQVIGPFHKSFSAIVGPNGSGKSNVIDALLFVFGYRANKMRQGKLSDLIHSSSKYPNCESCSVEIHFQEIIDGDGPGEMTPVPNSRLVVSRQAMRNSSSKYFINKRPSSFSEVTTLLRARGIDLDHKRFLILQDRAR